MTAQSRLNVILGAGNVHYLSHTYTNDIFANVFTAW